MIKTQSAPRRPRQRFKLGSNPDSLGNLGKPVQYEAKKISFSIGLTPIAKAKLKKVADKNELALSEVIERIARNLSADDIQKLVRLKPR